MKRFTSISVKIIVPIILVLTTIAVILIQAPAKVVRDRWYNDAETNVMCDEAIAIDNINEEVDYTDIIAGTIAELYADFYLTNRLDEDMIDFLCQVAMDQMDAEAIRIYDQDQNIVTPLEYSRNLPASVRIENAFNRLNFSGMTILGGSDFIALSTRPIIADDEVIGVIEVGTNLGTQEFLSRFPQTAGCEISIIYGGKIIHSTIPELKGTTIDPEINTTLLNGGSCSGSYVFGDESYTGIYFPYDTRTQIHIMVCESDLSMNNTCRAIAIFIGIIEVVCTIVILLLTVFLIFQFVLRPMKRTYRAIQDLSSGDADLTYRLPVKGHDEISQLCDGVNKFIEILQNLMIELKAESETINAIVRELSTTSQETAAATTQIMANIESVKNQAKVQANAVENTTSIISESTNSMSKLKENIVAQTTDITESSAAIEQMIGNINAVSSSTSKMTQAFGQLASLITGGSKNVADCSDIIRQIEEKSKLLGEANQTISSIAEQTNLLAMNAMIESAHAGDAGKGFAVVADEIRKLAESSSEQAASIEENIQEIILLIDKGGNLSNLSQQSFKSINAQVTIVDPLVAQISGAMDEQNSGSAQILESLSNMKNESYTVDETSRIVDSGIQNIDSDMGSVNEIASTILGSMDEMAAGSQQISRGTQMVSDMAVKTKDAMSAINDMIDKFKV